MLNIPIDGRLEFIKLEEGLINELSLFMKLPSSDVKLESAFTKELSEFTTSLSGKRKLLSTLTKDSA